MIRFAIGFVLSFAGLGAFLYWRQGKRAKQNYDDAFRKHQLEMQRAGYGPEFRSTNVRGDVAPTLPGAATPDPDATATVPVLRAPEPTPLAPTTASAGVSPTVGGVVERARPKLRVAL